MTPLTRADWEAIVADLRHKAAEATAAADALERYYLAPGATIASPITPVTPVEAPPPRKKYARRTVAAPCGKPARMEVAAVPEPTTDAQRLRDIRTSLGMSQGRVGEIAGYKGAVSGKGSASGAASIGQMEKGDRPVQPGLLDKLRELLRDKKLGDRGRVAH